MSNLFWYCSLAAASIAIAAFTICTKRKTYGISTLLVFYLFTAGVTWVGEYLVLGIFNGYAYKPGVFQDPWAENLLGHLILNTTIWPGAAMITTLYSLRFAGISLIAAIFLLIEYLFSVAGLYEQHWWRYYMSAVIIVVYLIVTKSWFKRINNKRTGFTRAATFYFVSLVMMHIPFPILLLSHKQQYNVYLNDDIYLSSTLFTFGYHMIMALLVVIFVCVLKKWYWKLAPYVIGFTVQYILATTGVFMFMDGWRFINDVIINTLIYGIFILLERFTLRDPGQPA